MAELSRPDFDDAPDAEPSTMFMPTQGNEGVGEDEHLAARAAVVAVEPAGHSIPWRWVAAVLLVILAVPLLADYSKSRRLGRAAAAASAAQASEGAGAEPAAEPQPAAAPGGAEPPPARAPGVVVTRPAGQPPMPAADGPRQMVTKCIEGGRVVYTQTGKCAGSVTAVPIDADKNVVGADRPPPREGPGSRAP